VIVANVKCEMCLKSVCGSTVYTSSARHEQTKKKNSHGSNKGLGRFRATFDETLDCEQVGHLKLLESRLFGLTYTEVRQLAYQLAGKNGIERGLNCQKNGWMGQDSRV